MKTVYITSTASFLPNSPINNDQIEDVIGLINGKPSRTKRIILRNNGIKTRYYVLDPITRQPVFTNAQLTAEVIKKLYKDGLPQNIDLISCGTTMPDQIAPGHAVMVHGELGIPPCETLSSSGICISGLMALKYAFLSIVAGDSKHAVATGSEIASTLLRAEHFTSEVEVKLQELEERPEIGFDKDFLRWMLSDGAGAVALADTPNPQAAVNLKIKWIKTYSYADRQPVCMYAGALRDDSGALTGWQTFVGEDLVKQGVMPIKQEVKLLNENIVKLAVVETIQRLVEEVDLKAEEVDYFLPHISSMYFYHKVAEAFKEMNFDLPTSKWFTNLTTKGNTGSASIFIMLDEFLKTTELAKGNKILCFVPESGRFSSGYMLLEVV